MTKNLNNIDIHLIVDDDDTQTIDYTDKLMREYGMFEVYRHLIKRKNLVTEFNLNHDYYNYAASQSNADAYWVFADDVEIVSPNWDEVVIQEMENFFVKYPDKVICVSLLDNTPPPSHLLPKFPCFPIMTKEARKALGGWILFPKVPTWGVDYVMYEIFHPLQRLLQLHNKCFVNHISWHTKQVGIDDTNEWIGHVFNQMKHVPHSSTERALEQEVPTIRGQLLDYCKNITKEQIQ
jgi:hypothetical protein